MFQKSQVETRSILERRSGDDGKFRMFLKRGQTRYHQLTSAVLQGDIQFPGEPFGGSHVLTRIMDANEGDELIDAGILKPAQFCGFEFDAFESPEG